MTDSKEPRKATDVLLAIESKLDALIETWQSIDFNQKLISNKLTELLNSKSKAPPQITVEAVNSIAPSLVDPNRNIEVNAEDALPIEERPNGFRRTSRPETYAGDGAYLNKPKKPAQEVRFPVQIPRGDKTEVIIPQQPSAVTAEPPPQAPKQTSRPTSGSVPVMQRIVDKNGKSIFLADIDIIDNTTTTSVFKTRTNGAGKWMASLPIGEYTVIFRKRDTLTKEPLELTQNIQVDGTKSPLDLPVCIIKN